MKILHFVIFNLQQNDINKLAYFSNTKYQESSFTITSTTSTFLKFANVIMLVLLKVQIYKRNIVLGL